MSWKSRHPKPKAAAPTGRRKPLRHQESDLQAACVRWFRLQPAYRHCLLMSIPNGTHLAGSSKERAIQMNVLKREGLLVGAADLLLVAPEGVAFLECKTAQGKQRESQVQFQEHVEALGWPYHVFRSLEDFIQITKSLLH